MSTPVETWDRAQAKCAALGGNLLTLNSPEEVEYIKTMRTLLPGENHDVT